MDLKLDNKVLIDTLACALFGLDESDRQEDVLHYTYWFTNYIQQYDNTPHSGDCTNQPYTCSQCVIDSYRDKVREYFNVDLYIEKE